MKSYSSREIKKFLRTTRKLSSQDTEEYSKISRVVGAKAPPLKEVKLLMSKKDVYRFWSLLDTTEEGASVRFPDLPGCLTSGDTAEEAYAAAREALEGFLYMMEQDGDFIPEPSILDVILKQAEAGEAALDVMVWMPTVRAAMESRAIKKTLTVPKWLNDAAESQRLNFSQVLQEGLAKNLGIRGALSSAKPRYSVPELRDLLEKNYKDHPQVQAARDAMDDYMSNRGLPGGDGVLRRSAPDIYNDIYKK